MAVKLDPVMGDMRQLDYQPPQSQSATAASGSATIPTLKGNARYVFQTPLKTLTVTAVEDSPLESEIVFTATENFTPATVVRCGMEAEYDSVEHTLTLDDATATGNDRTFSAQFNDDDPDWDGTGQWRMRAYVDPATRKWTVHSEFSGTSWQENPETGEWDYLPCSFEGVFAVAKEADTELEFVEWVNFNYGMIPRGYYIYDGPYVKTNGGNTPPVITIPATVGVIGTLPDFESGKRYILNFRDNMVVGAEIHQ